MPVPTSIPVDSLREGYKAIQHQKVHGQIKGKHAGVIPSEDLRLGFKAIKQGQQSKLQSTLSGIDEENENVEFEFEVIHDQNQRRIRRISASENVLALGLGLGLGNDIKGFENWTVQTEVTEQSNSTSQGDETIGTIDTSKHSHKAGGDAGAGRKRGYKMSPSLQHSRVQADFFAKLMVLKILQLFFINGWIALLFFQRKVRVAVVEGHNWIYLALGLFIIELVIIRIIAKSKSAWHPVVVLSGLVFVTVPIAYAMGGITFTYHAYCVPMATGILFLSFLTLPFVPYLTQKRVTHPTIIRVGAVLVLVYSVLILVVFAYANIKSRMDMTLFATLVWFPGLLMAEVVLWVMMYEIQRILRGFSFNISEHRWAFSALYV